MVPSCFTTEHGPVHLGAILAEIWQQHQIFPIPYQIPYLKLYLSMLRVIILGLFSLSLTYIASHLFLLPFKQILP